jgi:putative DNA primase/helicase
MDALRAVANLNRKITAPAWLDGSNKPDPRQVLAMQNGFLHIPERKLFAPSPLLWTHNSLSYAYEPSGNDAPEWDRFLDSIWGNDPASIATLQEIFGYLLTGDTRQQKTFLLVGPKRSGKGTIARILTALLGVENVCSPTLASLSGQFGLAPLINKLVAIVADARLGSRADQHQIAERLLSVSGEDGQTIDRKYMPPWNGQLPTRFFIMSNELPRLADASGALASRFIVLRMTKSFYGKEDQALTDRLLNELPSILIWALDGRVRLSKRGCFSQPQSSSEAMQELEDLSSPIGAFVRDCLEINPLHQEKVDAVFTAWKQWCEREGRDHPGTKATCRPVGLDVQRE